jgi:hypothetical protein
MKKHWYTTLFGALAALPVLAQTLGIPSLGHIGATDYLHLLGGIGVAGLGAVAADASKVQTKP